MARNSLLPTLSRALLAAAALWLLAGCTSTSLVEKWQDATFSGPPLHKLLVVSVQRSDGRRRLFEDGMATALARQGVLATASYTLLPDAVPQTAELSATASREGYDGVLVLHQLGRSTRSTYTPGSVRYYPVTVTTLDGKYTQVWQTIYEPGYNEIEQQLDLELQKPQPLPQCTVAEKHEETKPSTLLTAAASNNTLFAELLAHAVACGQTRVFNVNIGSQGLRKEGSAQTWHGWTHEEAVDEKSGVQPEVTSFIMGSTKMFADFLAVMDGYKEGSGTLLDRTGVMWMTDHGYARTHTMDNIPVMTFGSAGGRIKTGMHLSLVGDPATRVGLTMMQLMGVPVSTWGLQSNQTSKTITEIMA